MKKLTAVFLLLSLLLAAGPAPVYAAAPEEISREILQWNLQNTGKKDVQSWLDSTLAESAGAGAEWYILGLVQSGESYDFSRYVAALEKYVSGKEERSATARQKNALMFLACGGGGGYVRQVAESSAGELGIMSWVYGLHLANNGAATVPERAEIVSTLLSLQLPDGGWAVSGEHGDTDVTAMVVQALAPGRDEAEVAGAIGRALEFLSARQYDDGGFASYGVECPESIAQVVIALAALDLDAFSDERFIRNGHTMLDALALFRQSDGSYAHFLDGESNGLATVEVFCAMTAYERQQRGGGSLYLFDEPALAPESGGGRTVWLLPVFAGAVAVLLVCLVLSRRGRKE